METANDYFLFYELRAECKTELTCKSCKWFVMCLHVYDWLLVVVVESNPFVHFCVQERDLY